MHQTTKGILLRQIKYKENSYIVDFYTESFGLVSFIVNTSRNRKFVLQSVIPSPLSIMELCFYSRPGSNLHRIKEANIAYSFHSVTCHPIKMTMILFLQEVLYHALKREEVNPALYDYIESAILWLDGSAEHFVNFHLVFLMRLTRLLGFWPNVGSYQHGDVFDLLEGQFSSLTPMHQYFLENSEALLLPMLTRMNFRNMRFFRMNRVQRRRFLDVLVLYYRLHVPEFPELKSLNVLKEILS